jgi:hypothetical protein
LQTLEDEEFEVYRPKSLDKLVGLKRREQIAQMMPPSHQKIISQSSIMVEYHGSTVPPPAKEIKMEILNEDLLSPPIQQVISRA